MEKTEIEERTRAIIAEHLCVELEKVVPTANLVDDLGADSLDIVELVMAAEDDFHLEIPDAEYEHVETVQQVYNLMAAKIAVKEQAAA